jgi:hypothetical protein
LLIEELFALSSHDLRNVGEIVVITNAQAKSVIKKETNKEESPHLINSITAMINR